MAELPGAAVKRVISKGSGDLRISGSATQMAVVAAEGYLDRLGREAGANAVRERRKTIMDADIQKAREVVG